MDNSADLFVSKNGAAFSECKKYRYALWRIWDEEKPMVMFIGLNPSTANETENDPTIRRVIRFAKDWGYGGVYMMNLFPLVSTDPSVLTEFYDYDYHEIEDIENMRQLLEKRKMCNSIIFAWGNFKEAQQRAKSVSGYFKDANCLGLNKNGTPKHPLYIAANTQPIKFNHG